MFSKKDLDALIAADVDPAVSITLPTHSAGREVRQGHIRLDNLLRDAAGRLQRLGLRAADADAILGPARVLCGDNLFWRQQEQSLALFCAKSFFACHKLHLDLPEQVTVAHRFNITPLLPVLLGDESFLVLALSAGGARLYQAGRETFRRIPVTDMPDGISAVMNESNFELDRKAQSPARPQLQRSSPGMAVQTPGDQGLGPNAADTRKDMLIEYIRRVANAVEKVASGMAQPLILAATPEIGGNFLAVSRVPGLIPDRLDLNPDGLRDAELQKRAWQFFDQRRGDEGRDAVEHFESLFNDGDSRATLTPEEIVKGARFGRVDTLIVADGAHLWGRYDEQDDDVVRHAAPADEDEDLLNYAAIHTLRTGGAVRLVPAQAIPRGGVAAAIMRYGTA